MSEVNQIKENLSQSEICDKNLDCLENKINEKLIWIVDYYSYEKIWDYYYAIVDWIKLDIPLKNQEELIYTLKNLKDLLTVNQNLTLSWDKFMRYIEKDSSMLEKVKNIIKNWEAWNILISSDSKKENKNYVEEVFEFVMAVKKIPKEDWNIEWQVCKSDKESCISELWSSRVDYEFESKKENNTVYANN